eukprot:173461-Chlamydomonas_euryale.AAC.2
MHCITHACISHRCAKCQPSARRCPSPHSSAAHASHLPKEVSGARSDLHAREQDKTVAPVQWRVIQYALIMHEHHIADLSQSAQVHVGDAGAAGALLVVQV